MAILCLATSLEDLKERIGNIIVAYNLDGNPVYAKTIGSSRCYGMINERCH